MRKVYIFAQVYKCDCTTCIQINKHSTYLYHFDFCHLCFAINKLLGFKTERHNKSIKAILHSIICTSNSE